MANPESDIFQGVVVKTFGKTHFVRFENAIYECALKGVLRTRNIRTTSPIAVGDKVNFEIAADNKGNILSVEERKNYIIRKAIKLSKESHVIASNIDQALLVVTLKEPLTSTIFMDRFLVTAEAYRIPVILVFNKIDIYSPSEIEDVAEVMAAYDLAGYSLIETSVPRNYHIDALRQMLSGKVSVISGHSGVGKSSLINALDPAAKLAVSEISHINKSGKHTTSFAQMIHLDFGADIIDTPGIRGFGIFEIEKDELYHFFPEIFRFSENCKYYNCKHMNEPGCAVIQAVEDGDIAFSRYRSYLSMLQEDEGKFRKKRQG